MSEIQKLMRVEHIIYKNYNYQIASLQANIQTEIYNNHNTINQIYSNKNREMSQPTLMIAKKGKKVRFNDERLNN